MARQYSFVTDFDGTISDRDFFWLAIDDILGREALHYWQEYVDGRATHFEALRSMFARIHIPEDRLNALIDTINIDPYFEAVAAFCKEKDIPLFICSAGCDYYISRKIGPLIKKYDIKLVTNHADYAPETGLVLSPPPETSPYFDADVGISKLSVVERQKADGREVVFAGDGYPDIPAACRADYVFARDVLLQKLPDKGNVEPLRSFAEILTLLKEKMS